MESVPIDYSKEIVWLLILRGNSGVKKKPTGDGNSGLRSQRGLGNSIWPLHVTPQTSRIFFILMEILVWLCESSGWLSWLERQRVKLEIRVRIILVQVRIFLLKSTVFHLTSRSQREARSHLTSPGSLLRPELLT